MHLRTTTRRNANGQRVSYYQLAKNDWDADRGYSVARVIYNGVGNTVGGWFDGGETGGDGGGGDWLDQVFGAAPVPTALH